MTQQSARTEVQNKIGQLQEFLKIDPKNTELLINLGDLYHSISNFEHAIDCYQQSLDIKDSDIIKSRLASIKISQHQFADAEIILLDLIQKDENNSTLYFNLGLAQYQQRKWPEAETSFNSAFDNGTKNEQCLTYIARTLHHQHKFDEAKIACNSWITQTGSTEAKGYLALLEMDSGQSEKAQQVAHEVLQIDPDNTDAGIVIGVSDIEEQNIESAVKRFKKVLSNEAQHPRALFGLGMSHMHQLNNEQAIKLMEQASKQMPTDAGIKVTIGWAKAAKKDFKGAEAIFREVIKIDRNFSEGYGGLAYTLSMQGKVNEARENMQKAQWLDPGSFGAAASQSVILGIEKGNDESINFLSNALDMPPAPGQKPIIEHIRTYLKKYGPKPSNNVRTIDTDKKE